MAPQRVHALSPKTCDYVTLHSQMDFVCVIKLKVSWDEEIILDYSGGSNAIIKILIRGSQGDHSERQYVTLEVTGMQGCTARNGGMMKKSEERIHPSSLQKEHSPGNWV